MRSRRPPQIVATPGVRAVGGGPVGAPRPPRGRPCAAARPPPPRPPPLFSPPPLRSARFSGRSLPAGLPFAFLFQPPVHPVLQRDAARVRRPPLHRAGQNAAAGRQPQRDGNLLRGRL